MSPDPSILQLLRGLAKGLARSGYAAADGAASLGNTLLPGDPLDRLRAVIAESQRETDDYYGADASPTATTLGRSAGALALAAAGGTGLARGAQAVRRGVTDARKTAALLRPPNTPGRYTPLDPLEYLRPR